MRLSVDPQVGPAPPPFAVLAECRVVVAGFKREVAAELVAMFQATGAICRVVQPAFLEASVYSCDLLLAWLAGLENYDTVLESFTVPVIAAMTPESLVGYLPWMRQSAAGFFLFPCTEEEVLARAAMAFHRRRTRPVRSPGEKLRVLLADDDPGTTALLQAAIESDRMTCRCAANGLEALEIARKWLPDVAVLDVKMPGLDGYQVLASLRRETRRIPVLLLTGCDQESEIMKGFRLGAADYVVKPFDPMEVRERIKRIVAEPA
jgi:CheY-like chemotaxis protein